jgi:outer membrane protein TolC
MRRRFRMAIPDVRLVLVVFALTFTPLRATPQQAHPSRASPYRLTADDPLGTLVDEALRANPALAAERYAELSAEARIREARGFRLPSVAIDARYTEQRGALNLGGIVNPAYGALNELVGADRFPTNLDIPLPLRHETRLRVVQPVFNPTLRANETLVERQYDAQSEALKGASRKLAADVQIAYLDALSARSAVNVLEAALQLVSESERVAGRLVDAGRSTPEALFRARAERSEVQQQLDEARQGAQAAVRAFNHLIGRPLERGLDPVADSVLVREIDLTEEEAIASALAEREELQRIDAGVLAAEQGVRLAGATSLPSLTLVVDYGFQGREIRFGSDVDYLMATLSASWMLFNGGADQAKRESARMDVSKLREQRRELEDNVRLDVRQAYGAAVVARGAMRTADERLSAAQRTFDLVSRRYEEGVAPHIELVDARAALTSAQLNRALTLYRYVARTVDLERAAALRDVP